MQKGLITLMNERNLLLGPIYAATGRATTPLSTSQKDAWECYFKACESGILTRMLVEQCPQCRTSERTLVAQTDRYGDRFDTVLCDGCGLIYTANPFDVESTGRFYRDYYRSLYSKEGSRLQAVERMFAVNREKAAASLRMLTYLGLRKGEDLILDIGGGAGWFLHPLMEQGYAVHGADYDAELIEIARSYGIAFTDIGDVGFAGLKDLKPKLIVLREVLEHPLDPFQQLADVNALLPMGGYLYLTVPPLDELPYGYGDGRLIGLLQNAHNFLFDTKVLQSYLHQAGFSIIACRRNLRILVQKTAVPRRSPCLIPGNAARNLALLKRCETRTQYIWRGLSKFMRVLKIPKQDQYYIKALLLRIVSSTARREHKLFLETGV